MSWHTIKKYLETPAGCPGQRGCHRATPAVPRL
jgi:hypothetical protein